MHFREGPEVTLVGSMGWHMSCPARMTLEANTSYAEGAGCLNGLTGIIFSHLITLVSASYFLPEKNLSLLEMKCS